ncbi:cytochrome P450 alkane hydroxylase-like protein [Trichodelitschia bisporula]|uniref:Cytochrome P450 alkane hydroxylase-like protein n=1 Tax=Trichodelitschia bisporula TaxID=703511 RepID=A0A6G1I1U5_9PEZI|nr:cytochrome P450 alkane hydroxylase-like protein [Trichodelitschia bisporula]
MLGDIKDTLLELYYEYPWLVVNVPIILFVSYQIALSALENRRINQLGGHAPIRKNYLPYGLDMLYAAITSALANKALDFWLNNFQRFGRPENPWTIEAGMGKRRLILTADVENIKAILATQFGDYGKGEQFNKDWHDFLGDSIFTTDGAKWHDSRQLIRPQFVRDRLSDIDTFEKHVSTLLPMLSRPDGAPVDVMDLFFRFTLDTATDFLLGTSVDSLHEPATTFASAFNTVQHIQSLIARAGTFNWLIPRRQFRRELRTLNAFVDPYIDSALALSPAELEKRAKSDGSYTFLHAIAGYTRDRATLRDQLVAILLAGRDTTACSLSWLFYELSTHPDVVRKLRDEVLSTVGRDRQPTYEDLKGMKYLQHTLNETLRIYPIVPYNVRLALKDTSLPRGGGPDGNGRVGILKGTPIGYSTLVMQRREDLYPDPSTGFPDPKLFVPERWETWTPKSWTYIPFNGGPRICIGQQFALTEMAYTVTRILQRYSRVECAMAEPPQLKTDIVLQPAEGVMVRLLE